MDLLKQCQQWFEQDEAQKVIDTLEAILPRSAPRNWTASWPAPITIWQTHISQLAKKCSKRPSLC